MCPIGGPHRGLIRGRGLTSRPLSLSLTNRRRMYDRFPSFSIVSFSLSSRSSSFSPPSFSKRDREESRRSIDRERERFLSPSLFEIKRRGRNLAAEGCKYYKVTLYAERGCSKTGGQWWPPPPPPSFLLHPPSELRATVRNGE